MTVGQRLVQVLTNAGKAVGSLVVATATDAFQNAKVCLAAAYETAKGVLPDASATLDSISAAAQSSAVTEKAPELLLAVVLIAALNQGIGWLGSKAPVWKPADTLARNAPASG
jgi:hypothetical protein